MPTPAGAESQEPGREGTRELQLAEALLEVVPVPPMAFLPPQVSPPWQHPHGPVPHGHIQQRNC